MELANLRLRSSWAYGQLLSAVDYLRFNRLRAILMEQVEKLMQTIDRRHVLRAGCCHKGSWFRTGSDGQVARDYALAHEAFPGEAGHQQKGRFPPVPSPGGGREACSP